jgi:heptosyltransferase I
MRILLIKTSSLGDVVHNLPVVADIRGHFADAQIDWVVEENFAAIPRLHPSIDRVFPVAMRRWRKHLTNGATWAQWREFKRQLQERVYDFVIDTQGLLKSSLIARNARGLRCGYDWASAREPLASFAYQRKFNVATNLHAVERNRQLVAKALGYEASGEPSYGLPVPEAAPDKALQAPYVVMLHATSRADKEWPEDNWIALGEWFSSHGFASVFPSGSEKEFERARRLAAAVANSTALPPRSLDDVARLLSRANAVIGVDTGLTHLACAFDKPTVALYCHSDPGLTGVYGSARAINLGGIGSPPSVDAVLAAYQRVLAR